MTNDQEKDASEKKYKLEFVPITFRLPVLSMVREVEVFRKTRLSRIRGKSLNEAHLRERVKTFVEAATRHEVICHLAKTSPSNEAESSFEDYMIRSLEPNIQALSQYARFGEQRRNAVSAYCLHVMEFEYLARASTLTDQELLRRSYIDCVGYENVGMEYGVAAMRWWFHGRGVLQLVILGIMNEILKDFGIKSFPYSRLCVAAQRQGRALTNLQLRIMSADESDPSSILLEAVKEDYLNRFLEMIHSGDFHGAIELVNKIEKSDISLFHEKAD